MSSPEGAASARFDHRGFDKPCCCIPWPARSGQAKTWENERDAFRNGQLCTGAGYGLLARVQSAAGCLLNVPYYLFGGCFGLLGASAASGCSTCCYCAYAVESLCCPERAHAAGAGAYTMADLARRVAGLSCFCCCLGAFDAVRCPGNVLCPELQSALCGQHWCDLACVEEGNGQVYMK